jgi:hypothetical protein
MAVRITCINKDNGDHENPHIAIQRLGWINPENNETGSSTRIEMFKFLQQGGTAFVQDARGIRAHLVAKTSAHGNPYVQTVADQTPSDNLLRLPECRE